MNPPVNWYEPTLSLSPMKTISESWLRAFWPAVMMGRMYHVSGGALLRSTSVPSGRRLRIWTMVSMVVFFRSL